MDREASTIFKVKKFQQNFLKVSVKMAAQEKFVLGWEHQVGDKCLKQD